MSDNTEVIKQGTYEDIDFTPGETNSRGAVTAGWFTQRTYFNGTKKIPDTSLPMAYPFIDYKYWFESPSDQAMFLTLDAEGDEGRGYVRLATAGIDNHGNVIFPYSIITSYSQINWGREGYTVTLRELGITQSYGYENQRYPSLQFFLGGLDIPENQEGDVGLISAFPLFRYDDYEGISKYVKTGDTTDSISIPKPYTHWKFMLDRISGLCHLTVTSHNTDANTAHHHLSIEKHESYEGEELNRETLGTFDWIGDVDEFLNLHYVMPNLDSSNDLYCDLNITSSGICDVTVNLKNGHYVSLLKKSSNQWLYVPPNIIEFIEGNPDENSLP